MRMRIRPGVAQGTVAAPASKSMAHRLLIAAALSPGRSTLSGVADCEDVLATLDCLSALGVEYTREGDRVSLCGWSPDRMPTGDITLPCRESGSTLRFLLPIALLSGRAVTLTGSAYLLSRPMEVYRTLCHSHGWRYEATSAGITVEGRLSAGEYTMRGDISSQFISGMLMALAFCPGESVMHILPPFESRSYVLLTSAALAKFGVRTEWMEDNILRVYGGTLTPRDTFVEGDWSGAAFLCALKLLGGDVTVTGLDPASLQGDRVCTRHFEALGKGQSEIDLSDCPDLGPILFAVAAMLEGGLFTGTRRLRLKESDRAAVMAEELSKLGADITVEEDRVIIRKATLHAPSAPLDGHNDHRVVMSLAVLLTCLGGEIEGAEAVAKSYPAFFEDLASLGVSCERLDADKKEQTI